jgi:hypothetical protein
MKEEGRRKKEEGRRKKEEGRRKKEEGRRKKEFVGLYMWIQARELCVLILRAQSLPDRNFWEQELCANRPYNSKRKDMSEVGVLKRTARIRINI